MIAKIWKAMMEASLSHIKLWALILGVPVICFGLGIMVGILARQGLWPIELRDEQLRALTWIAWGLLAILAVVIVTLGSTRLSAKGIGGTSFEVGGGTDAENPVVETTTRTEIEGANNVPAGNAEQEQPGGGSAEPQVNR